MKWRVVNKNIKDWSSDELFDGVLCDPPYELGFMGKSWDSSGIAYDVEMWRNIFDHLKPGAHLLAFSGSRTYHRMACAIEDAGFEIRDMIAWVYGSGFPKSHNIGKAVDKLQGNKREVVGIDEDFVRRNPNNTGVNRLVTDASGVNKDNRKKQAVKNENAGIITKGNSPYEGWGTALKPALEPITVARKPLSEKTVAENCLKWGVGGINIDGCRVQTNDKLSIHKGNLFAGNSGIDTKQNFETDGQSLGRFPANLIHDGSDEVVGLFPDSKSTGGKRGTNAMKNNGYGFGVIDDGAGQGGYGDNGSAARFFYTAKASKSERNSGLDSTVSIVVQLEQCEKNITSSVKLAQLQVVMDNLHLKATAESGIGTKSGTEWSMSLFGNPYTEKYLTSTKSTTKTETSSITPSIILNYLTGLLTSENTLGANCEMTVGGSPAESVENSNTLTLTINEKTALALGVENAQSPLLLKISVNEGKNFHSTVKPLSLTKYLATLIKPPTGGRLLVPFSGSGSEMIGALQAGWDYVEGIELTEEYIPIAEARIKYWTKQPVQEELL